MRGKKSKDLLLEELNESMRNLLKKNAELKNEVKRLEHFKTTTLGLWATDRPDIIPEDLKKEYFSEIT